MSQPETRWTIGKLLEWTEQHFRSQNGESPDWTPKCYWPTHWGALDHSFMSGSKKSLTKLPAVNSVN